MLLNEFQIYASYQGANRQLFPVNDRLKFSWQRENGQVYYRERLLTKLFIENDRKLGTDDFSWLMQIENSCERCEPIEIEIFELCEGKSTPRHKGIINLSKSKFNLSRCSVELRIDPNDEYRCIDEVGKTGVNILESTTKITVNTFQGEIEYATSACNFATTADPCTAGLDSPDAGWTLFETFSAIVPGEPDIVTNTTWVREKYTGTEPIGGGWISIGNNTWVRGVPTALVESTDTETEFSRKYKLVSPPKNIDNGVLLSIALEKILSDCGFIVKSNFFSINQDGNYPSTLLYNEAISNYSQVALWQKTDIKVSEAITNANKAVTSFDEIFKAISEIFNVYYAIQGGFFVLEHITYFEKENGIDILQDYPNALVGKNDYSRKDGGAPRKEEWKWQETQRGAFDGQPIQYEKCADLDRVVTHSIGDFVADYDSLRRFPDRHSDKGIFIAALAKDDEGYYLTSGYDLDGVRKTNYVLSLEYLHTLLWRHDRYESSGYMNSELQGFFTVKRCKSQKKIDIPFCCEDLTDFDPTKLMHTNFGWGEIEKAEYDTKTKCLTVDILHDCSCLEDAIPDPEFCSRNRPVIVTNIDNTAKCVTATTGGDTATNQTWEVSTDGGITWGSYIPGTQICGFDVVQFRQLSSFGQSCRITKERTITFSELCENRPEIEIFYQNATNCARAFLAGDIGSEIESETWEASTDNGVTWSPYTPGTRLCEFGTKICFRATVAYVGGCESSTMEKCYTVSPPVCMNNPVLTCEDAGNGCKIPVLTGITSTTSFQLIQYSVNGGSWQTWNGGPICETGIIQFQALLIYCDGCPQQCITASCEGCEQPNAGSANPLQVCAN